VSLTTLSNEIVTSLKQGEQSADLVSALLSKNKTQVLRKDETDYWDFKGQLETDDNYAIADLAKDVLGFANAKGGVLIIGVDKNYKVVGIPAQSIVDSNRLNQKLRAYISPAISVFQDTIEVHNGKLLWLIFVPKRTGAPIACQKDGPKDDKGRSGIKKNAYYLRIRDEIKTCLEPFEFERLFSGTAATHQHAYVYDLDEPYFRLLMPHCDIFVGRRNLLEEVKELLKSRHPVISFDGVGGVGKSALAIELVRQLYDSRQFLFIVSLSAKSKVWVGYTSTRVSGFSGMTEFLRELASVLCVDIDDDSARLKKALIEQMSGNAGLLLIDNIEDVDDPAILHFLSLEVPDPVKVIVTSRIDRGLGALTKSIPEMDLYEARDLLAQELRILGYKGPNEGSGLADEIVEATGKLPLAIKWAASLAVSSGSLAAASKKIRSMDATKKEFLNFCFKTMFDELSPLAKDVATLSPFLGEEWRVPTLSVSLDKSEDDIQLAVTELRDRGIVLAQTDRVDEPMRLLPMTLDFLANKWHESPALSDAVNARLADAIGAEHAEGFLVNWPYAKRIDVVITRIVELSGLKEYERALKLIRLAKTWNETIRNPSINFLEGELTYLSGQWTAGISLMRRALDDANHDTALDRERVRLADALMRHGTKADEPIAAMLYADGLPRNEIIETSPLKKIVNLMLRHHDLIALVQLLSTIEHAGVSYQIVKVVNEAIAKDATLPFKIGTSFTRVLRIAASSQVGSATERSQLQKQAEEYERKFSTV
jgi:hypothetical protein